LAAQTLLQQAMVAYQNLIEANRLKRRESIEAGKP
jgi:hypothetical protein